MRILHLANHCDEVGNGIMNVAVDLACKQADLGHCLAFASAGGSYVDLIQEHGVAHHDIAQPWRRPMAVMLAALALRRLVKSFRPDIIHAHMMTGALLAHGLRMTGRFRLVTTVHNEWQRSARAMGVGDRVIAVSDNVRDCMQQRGIAAEKLRVVRNATLGSPRRPPVSLVEKITLDRPSIVTVAGLFERKGIRELISAFALLALDHPAATLYIVGDGPDRQAFETLAASGPGCGRIHFVGFIRDPRPYLAQADVFVLASRNDPSPLVIPEAREAGCAIVATAVGGIPESLDGGCAGMLVPPRQPESLAEAIGTLLTDPAERARLKRCSAKNLAWLHLDRAVGETLAIYAEILGTTADFVTSASSHA